jgi:hypothetical protein
MQCAAVCMSQIVDNCNTEADDAKLAATDTTTFSKANTIYSLKALKEEDWL